MSLTLCRLALPGLALLAACPAASAQSNAIRFNAIDYSPSLKGMGVAGMYVGLGYERNVNGYLAVSLEANTSYLNEDDSGGDYYVGDYNGPNYLSFAYALKYPWKEVAWQSKYFFSGNDDVSWYFGTGIAYRRIQIKWDIFGASAQNISIPGTLADGEYQESFSVFPLSFRLGHRNELDGLYTDYFIGLNINLGSVDPSDPVLKDYIVYNELSALNFCVGLNFGVGW
jgi:hypothetical protein